MKSSNHIAPKTSRRTPSIIGVIAVVSLLTSGCGTSLDSKTTPRIETESVAPVMEAITQLKRPQDLDDERIQDIYQEARKLVEDYFSISLNDVRLDIVDNAEIEKEVLRETRTLILPQFSNRGFAERFLSKIMNDQAGSYAALYTHASNRILVNRPLLRVFLQSINSSVNNKATEVTHQGLLDSALKALLIHESVHAADDQIHQIHDRRELNFRASFSQSAAYEGHAQLVTREICTEQDCLQGLSELDEFMFNAPEPTDPLARSMQAISRNVLEYSYIEGERFLKRLKEMPDGNDLLTSVLRAPPRDPVQILDPDNYPDQQRVARNQFLFDTMSQIPHSWNVAPWALVETSPIKGLDLRNDPERRAATLQGFTELIVGMIGAQVFDQSKTSIAPIEITVMQTDHADTAVVFAKSFHEKALTPETGQTPQGNILDLMIGNPTDNESAWPMRVYLSNTAVQDPTDLPDNNYSNIVASSDRWIIQIGGKVAKGDTQMIQFAEQLMTSLHTQSSADSDNRYADATKSDSITPSD